MTGARAVTEATSTTPAPTEAEADFDENPTPRPRPSPSPAPSAGPTETPTPPPPTGPDASDDRGQRPPTAAFTGGSTDDLPPAPTAAPSVTPTPRPTPTSVTTPTPTPSPTPTPTTPADGQRVDLALPPSDYDGEVRAIATDSGLMLAVRGGAPGSWEVVTPCYQIATVSAGRQVTRGVDVLIDPGHGGDEPGAVGPNGLIEADVNLDVALLVRDELETLGYVVELTRSADHRVAIQSRTELANAVRPRVFVSIHHNGGFPEPFDLPGTEVFFPKDNDSSRRLGGLLFDELQNAFVDIDIDWVANDTRGVSWRINDRGSDLYGVLRRTPGLVSVLTEAMFITSAAEADLLADPEILALEADAIALALDRWFTTDDPGRGFIDGLEFLGDLGPGGGVDGCVDPPLE